VNFSRLILSRNLWVILMTK
jgi:hypothetical protein